jgi:predicted DNA-binding antitoxin AbrB/MazE fold protein
MTAAIKATYEDGVFKPKERIKLPERTEVEVLIPPARPPQDDDPSGWKTADELIGFVRGQ